MIAEVSLRLLYLIFSQLLNWLKLLPRAPSSNDIPDRFNDEPQSIASTSGHRPTGTGPFGTNGDRPSRPELRSMPEASAHR
jgi:hypothetical protein